VRNLEFLSGGVGPYPTVQDRFAEITRRSRDAIAVSCGDRIVSYGALEAMSNRLARLLLKSGARSGGIVAIVGGRSIDMIVAWLAVLKAGCAYLPIEPDYPAVSRRSLLDEARPELVIVNVSVAASDIDFPDAPVLALDEALTACTAESAAPLDIRATPETPAYVMFTSGSVGKPKGVVVPHRGILRLVIEPNYAELNTSTVFLQLAPLGFDASTLEVYGPLLNGGRLEIYDNTVISVDRVAAVIERSGVNALWLTAGLFHLFAEVGLQRLKGLRQLLVGGDVLSPAHVTAATTTLQGCRVINGYGPTENTTFTCCYPVPNGGWGEGAVPIGFPVSGSTAHILDDALRPVVDGETGTLWTGGAGVALGYLNQPDLTAERFRPDPFAADGSLMYCTGDLARRRGDGAIEFLGRRDREIKLEGKRVALDDIELVLRRDKRVADAIVVARDLGGGAKRVMAFLKRSGASRKDFSTALREDMAQVHPAHMIPHEMVIVDSFPLNVNGKVDRSALMESLAAVGAFKTAESDQGSGVQATIVGIFKCVLGVDRIDVHRNFFEIGMTSLMLMRAHARIVAAIGRPFDITDMFSCSSIAALVAKLERPAQATAPSGVTAVKHRAAMQREAMQRLKRA
jgi:amino acid adenylation domain-containing protein